MNANAVRLKDGARIHLQQSGSGEPLILIPGWACSVEVFQRNIPALASRCRVIAYDPRSQGRSEQAASGNDYAQRGRDLHAILDALQIKKASVLGWSLGVYDALSYADQFGLERIRSLLLIDESPTIVKEEASDWGEGPAEDIAALIEIVKGPGYLEFFRGYIEAGFEGEAPQALLDSMHEAAAALPRERAAALLEDAAERDYRPISEKAARELPVLQVLRKEWADDAQRWIRAHQPSAEIEVLGGHMMLVEHAEAFNQRVLSFLRQH